MIRLFLLGLLALVSLIGLLLFIWLVFAIVKWVRRLAAAGNDYVGQQRQDWERRQAEKELPDFLVAGIRRMEAIEQLSDKASNKWQLMLRPVVKQAQDVVDLGAARPEQAEMARSFFTVTLAAMEDFVQALADDHGLMQDAEEEKAKQSLEVLSGDIQKYKAKLESKRRFDLQVMMEVLKQRLNK